MQYTTAELNPNSDRFRIWRIDVNKLSIPKYSLPIVLIKNVLVRNGTQIEKNLFISPNAMFFLHF